jgi:hypothetical protein
MHFINIGFAIGEVALVLVLPLAIITNLLTPRVADWYSSLSQRGLHKSLCNTEERLQVSEGVWNFSPPQYATFWLSGVAVRLVLMGLHTVFSFLLLGLFFCRSILRTLSIPHPVRTFWLLFALPLIGYIANLHLGLRIVRHYRDIRELHSDAGRSELRQRIARLKALLDEDRGRAQQKGSI